MKKAYKPSTGALCLIAAIRGKKYSAMSKKERRQFEKDVMASQAKSAAKTSEKNAK